MRVLDSPLRASVVASVAAFALGFGGVFALALTGGGFEVIARNQLGIALWWFLGLGTVLGLLPVVRPSRVAVAASALLVGFVAWMALGLLWTESVERTLEDLSRVVVVAGFFIAAVLLRPRNGLPRVIDGVAAAVSVVCLLALISRFYPGLFPGGSETTLLVNASEGRLSFPVDYWNGLAALAAVGIGPVLALATEPGKNMVRGLAAAFLPIIATTVFLTYSRTGIIACVLAVLVFIGFSSNRIQRFATILLAAVGSAVLIAAVAARPTLADGAISAAKLENASIGMAAAVILVCLAVGIGQVGLSRLDGKLALPRWSRPGRWTKIIAFSTATTALLAMFLVASGPAVVSDKWEEFKSPGSVQITGADRLTSFSGNHRYQFWRAAVHQFESEPLRGRGSGTFEFWNNRSEDTKGFVRDAHSFYLETLGELGIIGFLLLTGFILVLLVAGALRTLRALGPVRARYAAALSGIVAFLVTAAFDWTWELSVVPVAALLLAGSLLASPRFESDQKVGQATRLSGRLSVAVAALTALVVLWLPLSTASLLKESRERAAQGDLATAYQAAVAAEAIPPETLGSILQQALLLNENGEPGAALSEINRAIEIEPTNWRPWFVRSQIEARLELPEQSQDSFERARRLNPHSPILVDGPPAAR